MRNSPSIIRFLTLATTVSFLNGCVPIVAGGVAAGALTAADPRTTGTQLEDQSISLKTKTLIRDHNQGQRETWHVNITSYDRRVLLTGEVPDENARRKTEQLTKSVVNVRAVFNELKIAPVSTLSSRASDSWITSKVKARMVELRRFPANHVKVVTEAGVVYLLGIVRRAQGNTATEIARTTKGVVKVVTGYFEYLD